ncbi:MAG TPA: hypothetical protein VMV94_07005 [Phycisphaerae bacterium]|nr:hypothetical protein [Phycisphaerae bacterium]
MDDCKTETCKSAKRLRWLLVLLWDIDRIGDENIEARRKFRALRRRIQCDGFPFTKALDETIGEDES